MCKRRWPGIPGDSEARLQASERGRPDGAPRWEGELRGRAAGSWSLLPYVRCLPTADTHQPSSFVNERANQPRVYWFPTLFFGVGHTEVHPPQPPWCMVAWRFGVLCWGGDSASATQAAGEEWQLPGPEQEAPLPPPPSARRRSTPAWKAGPHGDQRGSSARAAEGARTLSPRCRRRLQARPAPTSVMCGWGVGGGSSPSHVCLTSSPEVAVRIQDG